MVETNFELRVKAEDQCAVEDQGVAKAKLQPRLLRLAMSYVIQRQRSYSKNCGNGYKD